MAKKRDPEPSSDEEEFEEVEEEVEEDEDDDDEEEEEEEEEEEDDLSSRESIRKLLEPFGKDQLMELLKDAALKNPALISRITASSVSAPTTSAPAPASVSASASDPADRKIFVHGLGWDATTEDLSAAFSPFGEIEECKAVLDRATGRCKGFGFVLFRTPSASRKALKEPQKKIGHRLTSCQLASLGPTKEPREDADPAARKIFVSGIGEHVSPEHLRAFFERFGEIEHGPLGCDPVTGRLLRFAIFVYRTVEGCKKALEEPLKFFQGCELHCKGEAAGGPKQSTVGMLVGLQPGDLALSRSSAGFVTQNAGFGNAGFGMIDRATDMAAGFPPSLSRSGTTPPYGVGLGFGRDNSGGINSISPSVIGRYGSPVLGAYQSSPSTAAMRYQSGIRYMGTDLPPYYGR